MSSKSKRQSRAENNAASIATLDARQRAAAMLVGQGILAPTDAMVSAVVMAWANMAPVVASAPVASVAAPATAKGKGKRKAKPAAPEFLRTFGRNKGQREALREALRKAGKPIPSGADWVAVKYAAGIVDFDTKPLRDAATARGETLPVWTLTA